MSRVMVATSGSGLDLASGGRRFAHLPQRRTEPPGTSRETKFTQSSCILPHRFRRLEADGITVHYDWGNREPPGELLIEVKGIAHKRLEAYWDGCIFVDDPPVT